MDRHLSHQRHLCHKFNILDSLLKVSGKNIVRAYTLLKWFVE